MMLPSYKNEPHGAIFQFSLPVGRVPAPASIAPGSRPSLP